MTTERKKILIADDEDALRVSLSNYLASEGFETHDFAIKTTACKWLEDHRVDLIISDMKAPVMDGMEFLRWVRGHEPSLSVPFLFLTGCDDVGMAIQAVRLGANDYMTKPYDALVLLDCIKGLLADSNQVRHQDSDPKQSAHSDDCPPQFDVVLECRKSELVSGLRHVKLGLPRRRRGQVPCALEVNIRPTNLVLNTFGASSTIRCTANCFAKALVPFEIVRDLVRRAHGPELVFGIHEGRLGVDGKLFESPSIHVVHPENQSTTNLTLNFTDADLVGLRAKHSSQELERLGLLKKVEGAEESLREQLNLAHGYLGKYGVSYQDLERIVNSRVSQRTEVGDQPREPRK
jgi:CheY-like chemotaxis protein